MLKSVGRFSVIAARNITESAETGLGLILRVFWYRRAINAENAVEACLKAFWKRRKSIERLF